MVLLGQLLRPFKHGIHALRTLCVEAGGHVLLRVLLLVMRALYPPDSRQGFWSRPWARRCIGRCLQALRALPHLHLLLLLLRPGLLLALDVGLCAHLRHNNNIACNVTVLLLGPT